MENTIVMCSINESRKLIFLVNEESSCGNVLKLDIIYSIFLILESFLCYDLSSFEKISNENDKKMINM